MNLVSPAVYDGATFRQVAPGDVANDKEVIQTVDNAAGVTLTPANLLTGLIRRISAAGVSDTLPSATVLIAALVQTTAAAGALAPTADFTGASFRFTYINANTGTLTLVAGTNCTLNADIATTIATVTAKEFLVQITCGLVGQIYVGTTVNASAVVTGLTADQTKNIGIGMAVSGTGIPASTTIISVQPGVGFTMSANATATSVAPGVAITFAPTYTVRAIS